MIKETFSIKIKYKSFSFIDKITRVGLCHFICTDLNLLAEIYQIIEEIFL